MLSVDLRELVFFLTTRRVEKEVVFRLPRRVFKMKEGWKLVNVVD